MARCLSPGGSPMSIRELFCSLDDFSHAMPNETGAAYDSLRNRKQTTPVLTSKRLKGKLHRFAHGDWQKKRFAHGQIPGDRALDASWVVAHWANLVYHVAPTILEIMGSCAANHG